MVIATDALTAVITRTPKKLQIAAMIMAFRNPIARVDTQVAIAFGASVHPLTRITPSVSTDEIISTGFCATCRKNSIKDIAFPRSAPFFFHFRSQYAVHSPILYHILPLLCEKCK